MNDQPEHAADGETAAAFLVRMHAAIAEWAGVPVTAVQSMGRTDFAVCGILVHTETALLELEHEARLAGEEPALVVLQTIKAIRDLSPIRLHHAIDQRLSELLDPPAPA